MPLQAEKQEFGCWQVHASEAVVWNFVAVRFSLHLYLFIKHYSTFSRDLFPKIHSPKILLGLLILQKKSLDPYISKFRKHRKLSHRTGRFNLDVMATLEEVDTEPVEDIDANMEAIAVNESEPIPVREPGGPRSCVDSTNETGGDNADRARSLFYFHSE